MNVNYLVQDIKNDEYWSYLSVHYQTSKKWEWGSLYQFASSLSYEVNCRKQKDCTMMSD